MLTSAQEERVLQGGGIQGFFAFCVGEGYGGGEPQPADSVQLDLQPIPTKERGHWDDHPRGGGHAT